MNTLGNKLKVTVFGQSHAPAIGCVIDGLPSGFAPDMERVSAFMARRAPGRNNWSTPRKESDEPEILSGLVDGKTCGAPVAMVIHNSDQHHLRKAPCAERGEDHNAQQVEQVGSEEADERAFHR